MKTLRAIYLYHLNERARTKDSEAPFGNLFFSIARTKQQYASYRKNNDFLKNHTITDIFTKIHNILQNDIKDSFYKIYITLDNLKKKILIKLASEILQNGNMLDMKINNHIQNYVFDVIDTETYKYKQIAKKSYKHIHIFKFDCKVVQAIQIPKIES